MYEVCNYMTDLQRQLARPPSSRRSWDRLPRTSRRSIDDIAPPFTERGWEAGRINDKTGIELAKAKGMTVTAGEGR